MRLFYSLVAASALGLCLSGCKLFEKEPRVHYQTVPANPNRDTPQAIEHHKRALKAFDDGNLDNADAQLQKALVADVNYGPAHNTLGLLYYRQSKLYLAAWEFEFANKLMPDRAEPLYNLGVVFESAGKLAEAVDAYSQAQVLDPENPHITGNLARARLRHGDSVDDIRYLLEAIVFIDTRPHWKGWAQEQLGLHPVQVAAASAETAEAVPPPAADQPTETPPSTPPGNVPPTGELPPPASPPLMLSR